MSLVRGSKRTGSRLVARTSALRHPLNEASREVLNLLVPRGELDPKP